MVAPSVDRAWRSLRSLTAVDVRTSERPSPYAEAAVVLLALVLIVAGVGLVWDFPDPAPVTVNGRTVPLVWSGATIDQALRFAGITARDGVLYSAGTRQVLNLRADPVHVERNGAQASGRDVVRPGDRITVRSGQDRIEDVVERRSPLAARGLPDVEHSLWVVPSGVLLERTGSVSGEVLERRVVTEPGQASPETRRLVALTFDDGPDPRWTPAILAVLEEEGVHATFCMVGSVAQRHPELVRAVAQAGHTLCNHTDHHVVGLGQHSAEEVAAELRAGGAAISAGAGRPALFYRAPGGTLTPGVIEEAHRQGLRVLGWTVDPRDWGRPGANVILDRVMLNTGPGAVVLLHDGGGDRSQTLQQLRPLIQRLRANGYQFTVPDAGHAGSV